MASGRSARDTPAVAAKRNAWKQQADALDAPAYRITLTSRTDKPSFNLGKQKAPDGGEQFYTRDRVNELIPYLSRQNARGYDVYVTPIDPDHHYLVVDDMTAETRAALEREGYRPGLVQESSADNQQAVIKVPRDAEAGKAEQSRANELVQQLNRAHGDPKFSGVVHPFRMAGFSNKKPEKHNAFTRIVEAAGGICRRATEALQAIRERHAEAAQERERSARVEAIQHEDPEAPALPPVADADGSTTAKAMRREMRRVQGLVRQQGWTEDWSRIDYRACVSLLKGGHSVDAVRVALSDVSPDLAQRHHDAADYASRTVTAAQQEVEREALERQRAQRATGDDGHDPEPGPTGRGPGPA